MPAGSLLHMAKRQAIRNIDTITDIGDLPYDFVRPILIKLENPGQLRELEKQCPQLAGEDVEVWRKFIKRDILNWEKKLREPSNPKSWSKVYQKLKQESNYEFLQQEEALRAALQVRADEKAKNTTTISTKVIDPEGRRKRFNQYHSDRSGQLSASSKADNARGAIDRIKRQTQGARMRRNAGLGTPAHTLWSRSSEVKKAPASMIMEHQLQQRQQVPIQRLQQQDNVVGKQTGELETKMMIPPRRGSALLLRQNQELHKTDLRSRLPTSAYKHAGSTDLASREARLKSLQSGSKGSSRVHQGTPQVSPFTNEKVIASSSHRLIPQHNSSTSSKQKSPQTQISPGHTHTTECSPSHASMHLSALRFSDSASPYKAPHTTSPKLKRKRQVNPLMPMKRLTR